MISDRRTIFSHLWPFFLSLGIFWIILAVIVGLEGYAGAFALLNQYHHPWTDHASLYFLTHLGDGVILPGIIILWVGRKEPGLAFAGILGIFLTGMMVQLLKHQVFPGWDRPSVVFAGDPSIEIFHPRAPRHHSFPSGHSASMVSGGLVFAIYMARSRKWLAFAVGAFTAALCYTRVVIGAHFPGDVLAGGLIGGIGGTLLLIWTWPASTRFIEKFAPERFRNIQQVLFILAAIAILIQFVNQIFFRTGWTG